MSDPKVEIAVWAGIPLAIVIIIAALDTSDGIEKNAKKLDRNFNLYTQYYLADGETMPFDQALDAALKDLEQQKHETATAVQSIAPALPSAYGIDRNYTQASARVTEDLATIRKLAERSSIDIPDASDFNSALSVDAQVFTQQLVYLRLYRSMNELLITGSAPGQLLITDVKKVNSPYRDADKSIAVFQMVFAVEVGFRRLERIMRLLDHNKKGLCLAACEIEVPDKKSIDAESDLIKAVLRISLLTPYPLTGSGEDLWALGENSAHDGGIGGTSGTQTGRETTRRGSRRGGR